MSRGFSRRELLRLGGSYALATGGTVALLSSNGCGGGDDDSELDRLLASNCEFVRETGPFTRDSYTREVGYYTETYTDIRLYCDEHIEPFIYPGYMDDPNRSCFEGIDFPRRWVCAFRRFE
ncbi:MAG: hypothetical protein AAF645_08010 [Myxococcota bacterium]